MGNKITRIKIVFRRVTENILQSLQNISQMSVIERNTIHYNKIRMDMHSISSKKNLIIEVRDNVVAICDKLKGNMAIKSKSGNGRPSMAILPNLK